MADTKKPLTDLTYYGNQSLGGITDPNDPRAQAALAAVQQYDPNARFVATQLGGEGGSGTTTYTLNYDQSKLPGVNGTGSLGGASGPGITSFSTVQPNMHLSNPDDVYNSPIYGKVTDNRNIQQQDDWIAKYGGPALVALFSMGVGGLAAAMSEGAIGGASSAGAAGAGGLDSGVGYDPWVEAGQSIPGAGTTAATGATTAGAADLPGGLGGGAADELANGGQYAATAPAANQTSIDVSNFMAAHGIPTQLGLSDGAVGAALSEPGFGLGSFGHLLQAAGKANGLLTGGTGGTGGGGGLLVPRSAGGGYPVEDATAILARFYGMPGLLGRH